MQAFTLAIKKRLRHNAAIMEIFFHRGDVIRKVREEAGLTKNALADRIKLPTGKTLRHNTMGDIERTGKVDADILELIARALNVPASYIMDAVPGSPSLQSPEAFVCTVKGHRMLHEMLEKIFRENERLGGWIAGNIITFHSALRNPPTGDPLGEFNNFSVLDIHQITRDTSRRKEPVKKVRRK